MKSEIILNKKKSLINSVLVPLLFCVMYILVYKILPEIKPNIDENLGKQFLKGAFVLSGAITFVISMATFWGNEFFSEIRYKKNAIFLDKKKTEIISLFVPMVFGIVLILFINLLPIGTGNNLLFVNSMKISIMIAIFIALLNSIIIFWLIVLLSREN